VLKHNLRNLLRNLWGHREAVIEGIVRLCGWSAILLVFAIFLFVSIEAAPVLFGMSVGPDKQFRLSLTEFFTSTRWQPTSEIRAAYGILAMLVGTLAVTGLAMLLAVPLGLGAAVYVSEFAGGRLKETLKILIELLAAVPSIVWGFVGYMVVGPVIIHSTGAPVGINLVCGGIILALMSVPIIVSVGEDALKAVPDSYR
jgi:phosphate transport system permease protein